MASSVQADSIRRQVRRVFQQHGASSDCDMCESLLIRSGFFCGRRFEMDGLSAIWFVEENELKVYGRDGQLLQTDGYSDEQRRVAA